MNSSFTGKAAGKENWFGSLKYKQKWRGNVAASPREDAVVAAESLTKEVLVGYLASGCKAKDNWR